MASTAGQLIQSALERIGAYAPGQSMNAADSARGLDQLNKLLDSLSNESLNCFAISEVSFIMTPGKTSYTIGTTGTPDISSVRPLRLREGDGSAYAQDSNGNNYPMTVVPQSRWNVIGNRTSLTQSNIPSILFYDPQFPLGVINIWPSPTIGYRVYFDSLLQLADMSVLTQVFSLPPGYELMLETNLSEQLWPFFKNTPVSPDIRRSAMISKRNVKRTNQRNDQMGIDSMLVSNIGGYNVYTDSYRPG